MGRKQKPNPWTAAHGHVLGVRNRWGQWRWIITVFDSRGRLINKDDASDWATALEDCRRRVWVTRQIEGMGHPLTSWEKLVERAKI